MKVRNRITETLEKYGVNGLCKITEEWTPVPDITFTFWEEPSEAVLDELRSLFPEYCRLHFQFLDRSCSLRSAGSLGPRREESQPEDARPATTCVLSPSKITQLLRRMAESPLSWLGMKGARAALGIVDEEGSP